MPGTSMISGLVSGLDTASIVDQLMELERQPVVLLEERQEQKQEELAAWQEINTKLLALKAAAEELNTSSNYETREATVSDDSILGATANATAPLGVYAFTVESLAKNHQMVSNTYTTSVARVGIGTVTFSLDSGDSVTFELTDDNNTLSQLMDAINDSDIGIRASILQLNEGSYQLYVYGKEGGVENTITVNSNLGTPPGSGITRIEFTDIQTASDAVVKMGSGESALTITGTSNSLKNIIPGLTLTLKKESPGTQVFVTVTRNSSGVQELVEDFVEKYNDVMVYISEQNTYDEAEQKGGVLMGDGTLLAVQRSLQDVIMNEITGRPSNMRYLFQLSISTTDYGTLTINEAGLGTLINERVDDVMNLFVGGIASEMNSELYDITSPLFGVIANVEDSLQDAISDMANQITLMEERLVIRKEKLYRQFTQMEVALNLYQTQSDYLTAQLSNLDKNWKD